MTSSCGGGWRTLFIFGVLSLGLGGALPSPAGQASSPDQAPRPPGTVLVLSAPSGTGKSTLVRELVQRVPDLVFGVSHTTRAPRPGEREGVDYRFVSEAAFERMVAEGRFLEAVTLYGHRYGLDRAALLRQVASGRDVLLDLDAAGAAQVRRALPGAVTVLLLPPSAQALAGRLRGRGTETEDQVRQRLGRARRELARFPDYDYLVVNRTLPQAFRELEAILLAQRARQRRMRAAAQRILDGF